MKIHTTGIVLATCLLAQAASAADMTYRTVTRTTRVMPIVPERAVARLADQGLGYSVLHEPLGVPQSGYRVHVTCTITETFRQTYCPNPVYVATCPNAVIACR